MIIQVQAEYSNDIYSVMLVDMEITEEDFKEIVQRKLAGNYCNNPKLKSLKIKSIEDIR